MPPTAGASGWRMSTAPAAISSQCSATLVSISPVAIGVSSDRASCGVALGVVGVQRLLDPDQVELLQRAAHPLGGRPVPLLVGVDHERHASPRCSRTARHAAQVLGRVGLADLDLDAADAGSSERVALSMTCSIGVVQEAAGGVVAAHGVAVGAEQLGQRQPGALGLEVPQRDVDRGDRLRRQRRCGRPRRRPRRAWSRAGRCRWGPRRSGRGRPPGRARTGAGPPARLE